MEIGRYWFGRPLCATALPKDARLWLAPDDPLLPFESLNSTAQSSRSTTKMTAVRQTNPRGRQMGHVVALSAH